MGPKKQAKVFKAVTKGKSHKLKSLLKGVPQNAIDPDSGLGLLHTAVAYNQQACLQQLLHLGLNPNMRDNKNQTPLHVAAKNGYVEMCEQLLAIRGIEASILDNEGRTPLIVSVYYEQTPVFEILIKHFLVDISVRDMDKNTVLHVAAKLGKYIYIPKLVAAGAPINSQNIQGDTPLHIAASSGISRSVQILIAKGADVSIKNDRGQTAKDIAIASGHANLFAPPPRSQPAPGAPLAPPRAKLTRKRSNSVVFGDTMIISAPTNVFIPTYQTPGSSQAVYIISPRSGNPKPLAPQVLKPIKPTSPNFTRSS